MAVLSDPDRQVISSVFQQDVSTIHEIVPILKADLRAAINAIDVWVDQNTVSFNTAIPQPARGALTAKQKAELLFYVVRRRFEVA